MPDRSMPSEPLLVPYFSLARALWIPRVIAWDRETGFFGLVDGPEGFMEYHRALEASRFLLLSPFGCQSVRKEWARMDKHGVKLAFLRKVDRLEDR